MSNETQDQLLTHIQYAKLSLQEAMATPTGPDGKQMDQGTINLYLGNAIYNLATALEELQPRPLEPKKTAPPQKAEPKVSLWQRLPLPAYYFVKASLMAMLQELLNTVRRS